MQKLNRPMVKLNINSKMVSTVHRIQVTWVTAIMWLMCSLPTQKPVRKHSLLKTTLHCVKLLIAAIKNIYTYVFMGTFFSQYLYDLLIVPMLSELLFASDKNKRDFVFMCFCCCEFYRSDRRGINLKVVSPFNVNFKIEGGQLSGDGWKLKFLVVSML